MLITEDRCQLAHTDMSSEELRLLDLFAVAYAQAGYLPESVFNEAKWSIVARRLMAEGKELDRVAFRDAPTA